MSRLSQHDLRWCLTRLHREVDPLIDPTHAAHLPATDTETP